MSTDMINGTSSAAGNTSKTNRTMTIIVPTCTVRGDGAALRSWEDCGE